MPCGRPRPNGCSWRIEQIVIHEYLSSWLFVCHYAGQPDAGTQFVTFRTTENSDVFSLIENTPTKDGAKIRTAVVRARFFYLGFVFWHHVTLG